MTRMPRPPPPATALMITGKPRSLATLSAFSSPSTGPSLPGRIGITGLLHRAARPRLVAEQADDVRRRADELDVAGLADLGEVGALRQEPVAGMNRVGAGDLGRAQHRRHVQVAVGAARRPDADVLVREADVQRILVGLRVHRDGLDAQFAAGANDPQRDLPAVGDQDFLEHCVVVGRAQLVLIANKRSPYCTGLPFST